MLKPYTLTGNFNNRTRIPIENINFFKSLVRSNQCMFFESSGSINLIGLRGVNFTTLERIPVTKDSLLTRFRQKSSKNPDFNDLLIVIYYPKNSKNPKITYTRFTTAPAPVIIEDAIKKGGLAHLFDGQYFFKIGTHNAYSEEHKQFIADNALVLQPLNPKISKNKCSYTAFIQSEPFSVWRETMKNSIENSFQKSVNKLFDDKSIKRHVGYFGINLHITSPDTLYSVGCQVVPDINFFISLVKTAANSSNSDHIPYFLIDSTKINLKN